MDTSEQSLSPKSSFIPPLRAKEGGEFIGLKERRGMNHCWVFSVCARVGCCRGGCVLLKPGELGYVVDTRRACVS
jgi:hypothetical protein